MAFLNKKEDVIDIELTSYGKKMLSKGLFRPTFYGFYDDDIIYRLPDEDQNSSQDRIKQDLIIRTIAEAVGVETRFEIQGKKILEGETSLYESMEEHPDPVSAGKLAQYELSNQNLQTQNAPFFTLRMLDKAQIDTDISTTSLSVSGVLYNVPQLNIFPEYVAQSDQTNMSELPGNMMLTQEDAPIDLMSSEITFLDGTVARVIDEKIVLSLVEENVLYDNENFEIEIYEILEENTKEQIVQIETMEELTKLFTIKTDESIDNYLSLRDERRSGLFGAPERLEESER